MMENINYERQEMYFKKVKQEVGGKQNCTLIFMDENRKYHHTQRAYIRKNEYGGVNYRYNAQTVHENEEGNSKNDGFYFECVLLDADHEDRHDLGNFVTFAKYTHNIAKFDEPEAIEPPAREELER